MTPSRERIREAAKALFAERVRARFNRCHLSASGSASLPRQKHFATSKAFWRRSSSTHGTKSTRLRLATESIASPRQKFR